MRILNNFHIVFLAALLAFPCLSRAADPVPVWVIQKETSTIAFEAVQTGAPFQGKFKSFDGQIAFDPQNLSASKADIIIPIDSIDAGSTDRNQNLPKAEWFDADKFPDAHFVTTAIEKGLDKNSYVAKGNLTIRDVSLPLTLPFTLDITKTDSGEEIATMKAETSINRLDFGIGQGQWKDTQSVENKVKITISVVAKKRSL